MLYYMLLEYGWKVLAKAACSSEVVVSRETKADRCQVGKLPNAHIRLGSFTYLVLWALRASKLCSF